jgi:hypothetical protein
MARRNGFVNSAVASTMWLRSMGLAGVGYSLVPCSLLCSSVVLPPHLAAPTWLHCQSLPAAHMAQPALQPLGSQPMPCTPPTLLPS